MKTEIGSIRELVKGSVKNPLSIAYDGGTEQRKSRTLNTIIGADLKIIEGLNLGGQYAANYYFRETDEYNPVLPEYYATEHLILK